MAVRVCAAGASQEDRRLPLKISYELLNWADYNGRADGQWSSWLRLENRFFDSDAIKDLASGAQIALAVYVLCERGKLKPPHVGRKKDAPRDNSPRVVALEDRELERLLSRCRLASVDEALDAFEILERHRVIKIHDWDLTPIAKIEPRRRSADANVPARTSMSADVPSCPDLSTRGHVGTQMSADAHYGRTDGERELEKLESTTLSSPDSDAPARVDPPAPEDDRGDEAEAVAWRVAQAVFTGRFDELDDGDQAAPVEAFGSLETFSREMAAIKSSARVPVNAAAAVIAKRLVTAWEIGRRRRASDDLEERPLAGVCVFRRGAESCGGELGLVRDARGWRVRCKRCREALTTHHATPEAAASSCLRSDEMPFDPEVHDAH